MSFNLGSVALSLFLLFYSVSSAGVGIHTTIISRIHNSLPDDLQSEDLYPYLLAGSFFPDAFYSCGDNLQNASEAIHWPPFLSSAVKYYKKHIAQTEENLKLKAFLYGVFSHQVTDSSWHSIRMEQGILPMLAVMEFNGNINDAHSFLDTAGDFLYLMKIQDTTFYKTPFKFPNSKFLLDIMSEIGYEIPSSTLLSCSSLGQRALSGEIRAKDIIGPLNAEKSPLLDDVLESYYLGGLQEITNSIINCLPKLNYWFENDIAEDPWLLCGSLIEGTSGAIKEVPNIKTQAVETDVFLTPWIPHGHFGHSVVLGGFLQEPSLAIGANYEENQGSVYIVPLSEFTTGSLTKSLKSLRLQGSTTFEIPNRFGSKVVNCNIMGMDFLIVNEPGTSTLYIYYGNNLVLTILNHEASNLYGTKGIKELYTSIFVHEFDDSGIR